MTLLNELMPVILARFPMVKPDRVKVVLKRALGDALKSGASIDETLDRIQRGLAGETC